MSDSISGENKKPSDNIEVNIPPDTSLNINSVEFISDTEFVHDFWLFEITGDKNIELKGISREGILKNLESHGFFKRYRNNNDYYFIREQDNIISEVEPSIMKDFCYRLIKSQEGSMVIYVHALKLSIQYEKLREVFLRQSHLIFNDTFLGHLTTHTKPILRDAKTDAYFFFKNIIIKVTNNKIAQIEYGSIMGECIWDTQIINHDFTYLGENIDCHFALFVSNVTNHETDRYNAFQSAIGYLLHNYSEPSKGQAVIAYDEEITDLKNPMGGTGKGLMANALKQMRHLTKIDGKKFDANDKFKYQDVTESTQVVWLDDVKAELGFETFHSILTDGWHIEKKYKDQFYIAPKESPKMYICSNSILNGSGSTNKRRQVIIEFSNHYSKHIKSGNEEPIRTEHGCIFFDEDDWNKIEWDKFFSFMLDCVRYYFVHGIINYEYRGLNKNRLLQTTSEDFFNWVEAQNFATGIDYNTSELFEDFRNVYYGLESDFKQRGFTNWIKKYAESKGWQFKSKTSNSKQVFSFYKSS